MLSKDHFSNILNPPAGAVAAEILKDVAPRVLYAWQNPSVPVDQVLDDCMKVFHHPAVRDMSIEVHRTMFEVVRSWIQSLPDRGDSLNKVLGSEGVRNGKNHKADVKGTHTTQLLHLAIWACLDLGLVVQVDSTSSWDQSLGVGTKVTITVIVGSTHWPSCRRCLYRGCRTCLPTSTNSRRVFRADLVVI
jgi:hypothetical protein